MKLPSFNEFLISIDPDKIDYDLSMYSSAQLKENYNPFTQEQYALIVKTNLTMMKALLAQYHQWLNEQLTEQESLD